MGFLGAVIVSTPQDVALIDTRRGLNMFRTVNVPVRSTLVSPTPVSFTDALSFRRFSESLKT